MDNQRNSLRAMQDSSNRRSQVVTNNITRTSQDNAYVGKNDSYGSMGLVAMRKSTTNNPSSHRQSRMVGKSHVNSNIEKVPVGNINTSIDHSLRNSGALRNMSLANKPATMTIEAINVPKTT